eukprot:282482_1
MSQKGQSSDKIALMDRRLNIYYKQQGRTDYRDDDGIGRFAAWCGENGFDETDLEPEFNQQQIDDCQFIAFDPTFPLPSGHNEDQKNKQIFRILKKMYEGKSQLFLDEFKLKVSADDMLKTHQMYAKCIKTWGTNGNYTQLSDINTLYFLTLSRMDARMNLLLNVVDSYRRDIVAQLLKNRMETKPKSDIDITDHELQPEQQRLSQYITTRPFLVELRDALQKIQIDQNKINQYFDSQCEVINHKNQRQRVLDLEQMIRVYPDRIGPRLRPHNGPLINDNLETISKYIVASAKFVHKLIDKETKHIGGVPCLIDFIIILEPAIHRDQSPHIYYDNADVIGDVIKHLHATQCTTVTTHVAPIAEEEKDMELETPDQIARKFLQDGFFQLRDKIQNKDKTYPSGRRFNMIIDRRVQSKTHKNDKDVLIMFEPPADCNRLPKISIPETYFDLSRLCLIPKEGYVECHKRTPDDEAHTKSINATTVSHGQIFTLSYHVWAADAIKCYLLWQGQCHRFYPQDILELLPFIFEKNTQNKQFIASNMAKKLIMEMPLMDTRFEKFYRGLNRLHEYEFPRQYEYDDNDGL